MKYILRFIFCLFFINTSYGNLDLNYIKVSNISLNGLPIEATIYPEKLREKQKIVIHTETKKQIIIDSKELGNMNYGDLSKIKIIFEPELSLYLLIITFDGVTTTEGYRQKMYYFSNDKYIKCISKYKIAWNRVAYFTKYKGKPMQMGYH